MAKTGENTAQDQGQQDQQAGPSQQDFEELKKKVSKLEEESRLGFVETVLTHPFKHMSRPGVGNKVEGALSLGGRGAAAYGIYRGVKWAIGKIWG